ncbi:TetR/AcrR family transcriptional regulator [Phenylobacterium terrae]|uniref:TetR/AcrR family transcriptional regulator n=1 Tax=Phenylobacterium terrae TaxID=2665495 RepID=A0ABW4N3J9_9CAUL
MYRDDALPAKTRVRNPAQTRERLLSAAFEEMHRSGFRGTDLETILARAGVTKGAMYHHFPGKQAIGYAVVDEVIAEVTRRKWLEPLAEAADPIATLIAIIESTPFTAEDLEKGCPLSNFSQEMSPLDEGFRMRTGAVTRAWREAIAEALRRGQAAGLVSRAVNAEDEAVFLIAAYQGGLSLAKNTQDEATLRASQRTLVRHLESLRA